MVCPYVCGFVVGLLSDCEGCGAASCIYDCELQCVDADTAYSWIGDGFCDDGSFGIFLVCEEFDFDGGDCGGDNQNGNHDKEYYHVLGQNNQVRLNGYNLYRDNSLLATVSVDETSYIDSNIEFGTDYCYKAKAIYDEGESNPTNEECGSVIDPEDFLYGKRLQQVYSVPFRKHISSLHIGNQMTYPILFRLQRFQ